MAWAEEKVYNQSGGGPFMGLIRKEGSTGNDPMTWSAARVVNQGAFPNPAFGAGEMFISPMGTKVKTRMEPEWYEQRGQPFIDQQIGTDAILDLYNEEENYAGGGIASFNQHNRPEMFLGGLLGASGSLLGLGALMGLGKMFGGRKRRGVELRDSPMGKKFKLPIPRTGPAEVLDDEEVRHGLLNRAEGGAVRPGYSWGGGALSALGKLNRKRFSDREASDFAGGPVDKPSFGEMANTYSKYGKNWNNPIHNFIKEHGPSLLFANPISNALGRLNKLEFNLSGALGGRGPGMGGMKEEELGPEPINPMYGIQDYNEGGAVGLEPGIGSLMGRI